MKKIPIIIDCDPGVDDALAIMLAKSKECFDIKAITSVAGNVGIEFTTHNMRMLKTLLNLNCPIAKGEDRPLIKKQLTAAKTHGADGFGGYAYLLADISLADLSELSAVKLMAKILSESEEKIVIVAVGPLTNVAILLKAYPELKEKIAYLSIMGGGINYGNVTPCAEFNFYVDPEAANIVFNSGIKIVLAALDATLQAYISEEDIKRFEKINNNVAEIATKILASYASNDTALHDPVSLLAISNPEIFIFEDMYINIETNEGATRAMSFADMRFIKPDNNVRFIKKTNRDAFIGEIEKMMLFYGS